MSCLVQILIASSPAEAMRSVESVRAIAGTGLEGDRYAAGVGTFSPHPQRPDFEVTLIEVEQVRRFAEESGLPFRAEDARRNLVTEGVDLNALVGRRFTVGEVTLEGIRLCEPCSYLARISHPETLRGLVHRGGLRARIVVGGELRVGAGVGEERG